MPDNDLDEKKEYMQEFINSSRDLLDDVEPQIIALEKTAQNYGKVDDEILNTIFRLFHTLKGTAAFVDLNTITSVTHEAETLLDMFRKGEATLDGEHIDLLCRTSDFVRNILDTVEKELTDEEFKDIASSLVKDLKGTITAINTKDQPIQEATQKAQPDAAAKLVTQNTEPVSEKVSELSADTQDMQATDEFKLIITPEMTRRFTEESLELCEESEMMLLAYERVPDNRELADNAFRALHSLKGNSGFFGFADIEKVSHTSETALDKIRSHEIKPTHENITVLLTAIDVLRNAIKRISTGDSAEIPEKTRTLNILHQIIGEPPIDANSELAIKSQPETNETKPVQTANLPAEDVSFNIEENAEPEITKTEKAPEPTKETINKQIASSNQGGGQQSAASGASSVIRVDIEKLDSLLDLVGELVIAEAMVANNPDIKELQLEKFEKSAMHLNKITRDIQEVALSMRMIPLAQTFHKMERLVRDLSYKGNKKVNLIIAGEETEVDKTIIEQISDPLVHLIRNSVDHGLESNEERKNIGKHEIGTVKIEAKHSAGEVWIIVEDDGRGLNRDKIFKKGVERGLIKDDGRVYKDEEIWKLIFEPGFSTAEKISNISGRGVGMDVVKRNIEKLRGKVDVRTSPGRGTMFVLRIPLTLAIIDGMVITVGNARYTIPISSIRESIKPTNDQVTLTPDNVEVVKIRGELLPIIRLHKLYNIKALHEDLTEGLLIIVENNDRRCCLFVDELLGQQQIVIKGLSSYLGHVKGISGCAIMGDGDISLILDIGDLIESLEKNIE